jgi:hypothetical protein
MIENRQKLTFSLSHTKVRVLNVPTYLLIEHSDVSPLFVPVPRRREKVNGFAARGYSNIFSDTQNN